MAKAKPKQAEKPQGDELDRLAAGSQDNIIAMLLWKNRHANPEMTEKITLKDLQGFRDCVEYLKVKPAVRIERPQGRPAQEGRPAVGNKRAVPAVAAEQPRPFVVVGIVDEGTVNSIRPVENNEEDNQLRIRAEEVRRAREQASGVASTIENMAATGDYSSAEVRAAAQLLRVLASA